MDAVDADLVTDRQQRTGFGKPIRIPQQEVDRLWSKPSPTDAWFTDNTTVHVGLEGYRLLMANKYERDFPALISSMDGTFSSPGSVKTYSIFSFFKHGTSR